MNYPAGATALLCSIALVSVDAFFTGTQHSPSIRNLSPVKRTTRYASESNDAYLSSLNRDTDEQPLFSKLDVEQFVTTVNKKDLIETPESEEPEDVEAARDEEYMTQLLKLSQMHNRNEHSGPSSPFPKPIGSCMIVSDGGGNPDMEEIIGVGHNSFDTDCVFAALTDAGIEATPLREWIVNWPSSSQLRTQIAGATLYTTLEPSCERRGTEMPPLTDLIHLAGIKRVVIGSQDPIAERATNGAAALHADGLQVYCGVLQDEIRSELNPDYISRINGKLARFGRTHAQSEKRPMGFLHCSVIDSLDVDAFARSGNAFGGNQAGAHASHNYGERDFGAYELAPPPERVWADSEDNSGEDVDGGVEMDDALFFEDEEEKELTMDPMMPWYEQVDAVIATFPKMGNGPLDDNSVKARLSGLQWLATQGLNLPPGVERILVLGATDL